MQRLGWSCHADSVLLGMLVAVAFAEESDWLAFPTSDGAVSIHKDCVHRFHDDFHVIATAEGGDAVSRGGVTAELPPCPHSPRRYHAPSLQKTKLGYYSDWVAYAKTASSANYSYMSSDWTVPKAPKSTGPVPGISSIYFFNGLEDGAGVHGAASYVLQPVLSYGKSGCIIDPLLFFQWHLTSFSVSGAGRAYCGKRIHVDEGEAVRGIMRLEDDHQTWTTLSIRLKSNETSSQSTALGDKQPNAAYLTLEAMVNYNCQAFPESGSLAFTSNVLKSRAGSSVTPSWSKMLRHKECNQDVQVGSDGTVTITWGTDDDAQPAMVV